MRSVLIVIRHILTQCTAQVPLADYEQVIQAFFSNATNPASEYAFAFGDR